MGKDLIDDYIWFWVVRILVVIAIIFVLGFLAARADAGMVTACTHATPPTLTGSEKEQDVAAEKYRDKEAARDELCSTLPPLKYLPYAWQYRHGDWEFRIKLYLRWRFNDGNP